ncbi:MAG TPA: hypothetical protein VMC79_07725 [Rectinemataceae bacterium]|nr:hypothetical protein [Rectinemataceae bacterium]
MEIRVNTRRAVVMALVFAAGICVGAAATLGFEVATVRQVLIARIKGQPIVSTRAEGTEFLTRLVSRELSLDTRQRQALRASIAAHREEILRARETMAASIRAISGSVYADLEPVMTASQRAKARSYLAWTQDMNAK